MYNSINYAFGMSVLVNLWLNACKISILKEKKSLKKEALYHGAKYQEMKKKLNGCVVSCVKFPVHQKINDFCLTGI